MDASNSDALVFFGATGDLAFKHIFPALRALVQRHGLDIPIIGVAFDNWTLDQLKALSRDSLLQTDQTPARGSSLQPAHRQPPH